MLVRLMVATFPFLFCFSAHGQSTKVDLLKVIDLESTGIVGSWDQTETTLVCDADGGRSICPIDYDIALPYTVSFQFIRRTGEDLVGIVLPLGQTQVLLELGGWKGDSHGLARVDSLSSKDESNPTSVRPGTLENGRPYQVEVEVSRAGEDSVSIAAKLDGKALVDWEGNVRRLEPNIAFRADNNRQLAVVSNSSTVVFEKLVASTSKPAAMPNKPAAKIEPGKMIDLVNVDWREVNGTIDSVMFQGERVAHTKGQDNTVAYLPGVELGDGVIEVEIASDIFSGIAIRGSDTSNYDLIYFRPQNSGTAKHQNSVQYVSKGVDGADWRTLRTQSPGKYEAGAEMTVNEWFKVRIELDGKTLTTYVEDFETPVLVVEEMLGERASGKIGLWGWDTRFRNLRFEPRQPEVQ